LRWCEQNWWLNGHIPRGILVSSVVKYLFYREWFSVMQLVGTDVDHLGYYVDIDTPMRKVRGEYYLTDLFLDLWIFPDGTYIELDRDEFEESYQSRLITQYQYRKANQVIEMLKGRITNGNLFNLLD
jgi:predicted RNA-binding protein associated with RNAse of E/G family